MITMVTFELDIDGHDRETFAHLTDRWGDAFDGDVDAGGTMGGPVAQITAYVYRSVPLAELPSVFEQFWSETCAAPVNVRSVKLSAEVDGRAPDPA